VISSPDRHGTAALLCCAALLAAAAAGCGPDRGGQAPPAGDTTAAGGRRSAGDSGAGGQDVAAAPRPGGNVAADPAITAAIERFRARVPEQALVRRHACPFECCTYRQWTAEGPIPVVAGERSVGPPLFTVPQGQRFQADSGNVWVTGLMLVAVRDSVGDPPYWSFAPGDTLVVLDAVGEGYFNVWHAGQVREVAGFWEPWRKPPVAGTLGEQRTEWWVHVTLPDGRAGWFEASPEVRFSGADACG